MKKRFLYNKINRESGQSLVEMALITPLLLLLLCGIIEFGIMFGTQLTIQNDSREGARYAAIHAGDGDVVSQVTQIVGSSAITSDKSVTLSFTDSTRKSGYVTVTVKTTIPAITPVGYMVFKNKQKQLVSATTMKVE
jgi:Flp pilus assembly protein TadG